MQLMSSRCSAFLEGRLQNCGEVDQMWYPGNWVKRYYRLKSSVYSCCHDFRDKVLMQLPGPGHQGVTSSPAALQPSSNSPAPGGASHASALRVNTPSSRRAWSRSMNQGLSGALHATRARS